eukprot:m51a1_g5240 hypothetical protein (472) ;mRNA; f:130-9452
MRQLEINTQYKFGEVTNIFFGDIFSHVFECIIGVQAVAQQYMAAKKHGHSIMFKQDIPIICYGSGSNTSYLQLDHNHHIISILFIHIMEHYNFQLPIISDAMAASSSFWRMLCLIPIHVTRVCLAGSVWVGCTLRDVLFGSGTDLTRARFDDKCVVESCAMEGVAMQYAGACRGRQCVVGSRAEERADIAHLSSMPMAKRRGSAENEQSSKGSVRLVKCNLGRADLRHAKLGQAQMEGVDLAGAELGACELPAVLMRRCGMRGADLRGRNLRGCDLRETDMGGAVLAHAMLGAADMSGAVLEEAEGMETAEITATTVLSGAHLSSSTGLRGRDLRGVDLSNAELRGADVRGADLRGTRLEGADMSMVVLRAAKAVDATTRMSGVRLSRADLAGMDLRKVDMSKADLSDALVSLVDLRGANLTEAVLPKSLSKREKVSGANLTRVDLSNRNLSGFDFSGAVLQNALLSEKLQ